VTELGGAFFAELKPGDAFDAFNSSSDNQTTKDEGNDIGV